MILPDHEIARRCLSPEDFVEWYNLRAAERGFDPQPPGAADGEYDNEPMIVPFIPNQIKTRKATIHHPNVNRDPNYIPGCVAMTPLTHPEEVEQKIVSYGLSSGGYDVRLDRKFKIFTNVNNALVDPLDMQDGYYVDKEGEFAIIPPNSYLLGVTMETFNIPRNVMVIALGKSTLARIGCIVNVTPIEPGWKGKIVIEIANTTPLPVKVHAEMGVAQFVFHEMKSGCMVSYGDRGGKYQGQTDIVTAKV